MCAIAGKFGSGFEVKSYIPEQDVNEVITIFHYIDIVAKIHDGGIVDLYPTIRGLTDAEFREFKIIVAAVTAYLS